MYEGLAEGFGVIGPITSSSHPLNGPDAIVGSSGSGVDE